MMFWGRDQREIVSPLNKEVLMEKTVGVIKFDHVHIKCRDVNTVEKFYKEMFNAQTVDKYSVRDAQSIMMDLGGTFIILVDAEKGEVLESPKKPRESPMVRFGLGHFGVSVRNLDEAAQVLREKGAEFLWEPRDSKGGRIRVAFIRGPEDDVIEIVQRND
jgi:catechol 2,3-dioxygenase-like lactoylglutathione lyase family enzyme